MTNVGDSTDEELLAAMLRGEEWAFTDLYRRRQAGLYRFALQMSGSESVAEEVIQEVFLALMRDGSNYDSRRGSVAAFLYGIARNKVLRSLDRESRPGMEQAVEETASPADGPLEELARSETVRAVRGAVLALPAHYREAVVLCDLQEMAYEEAARVLGCAVGTVRSRLHRGRELLADKLRPAQRPGTMGGSVSQARSWL